MFGCLLVFLFLDSVCLGDCLFVWLLWFVQTHICVFCFCLLSMVLLVSVALINCLFCFRFLFGVVRCFGCVFHR